jgi:hypothetical protein
VPRSYAAHRNRRRGLDTSKPERAFASKSNVSAKAAIQRAFVHPAGTGANAGPGKPDQFQKVMSAASGDNANSGREVDRARYPALSAFYPNVSWADCSTAAGACLLAAGGDTRTSARDQVLIVPT